MCTHKYTHLYKVQVYVCLLFHMLISDVNECLNDNGDCNHICINTYGSHYCKCNSNGYALLADDRTCIGMYVSFHQSINNLTVKAQNHAVYAGY